MNPTTIIQAAAAILAPLITLAGLASRRRRLRNEIRDNLSLVQELEKDEVLKNANPALGLLRGKIVVDTAKLAGYPLGTPKKPIPKGSVAFSAIFGCIFGLVTYYTVRNGFVWYSVFPALGSFLFFISIIGMFTNRELPPETATLPQGAVPMRTETESEQVATTVALASSGDIDERFEESGQIGVVLKFFSLMHTGDVEDGFKLSDANWQLCMLQTWLWRTHHDSETDTVRLDVLAKRLLEEHAPTDMWDSFMSDVARMFVTEWGSLNPDDWGVASQRRRLARDYDLVVLAPITNGQGYFVATATLIPGTMRFVVHHAGERWLIANHAGTAPPSAGWPPSWWVVNDPDIVALSDDGG